MTTTSFGTWNTTTDSFRIVLAGFKDKKDHLESDYTKAIMPKKVYLNDLDRGLIDGHRRPSSNFFDDFLDFFFGKFLDEF